MSFAKSKSWNLSQIMTGKKKQQKFAKKKKSAPDPQPRRVPSWQIRWLNNEELPKLCLKVPKTADYWVHSIAHQDSVCLLGVGFLFKFSEGFFGENQHLTQRNWHLANSCFCDNFCHHFHSSGANHVHHTSLSSLTVPKEENFQHLVEKPD